MYIGSRLELGPDDLPTRCVCEIYSPPRVDSVAQTMGFGPGISMDRACQDADGEVLDFDKLRGEGQGMGEESQASPCNRLDDVCFIFQTAESKPVSPRRG